MKLESGKWYRTRDGRRAFVGFYNERRAQMDKWVGKIDGEADTYHWYPNGTSNGWSGSPLDLIAEWTDSPAVGSSAWANSLPVGSKVRFKEWDKEWYVIRTENGWARSHEILAVPGQYIDTPSGWLLYTEPKLRPWTPEEVPLGAWIREKQTGFPSLIVGVMSTLLCRGLGDWINFKHLMEHYQHSTDNGATWKPCGVEE